MTIAEINNPKLKRIVKYAILKGGFIITVSFKDSNIGFRIKKKDEKMGWDIIDDLIFKSGLSNSISELTFSVFEDSIIIWNNNNND